MDEEAFYGMAEKLIEFSDEQDCHFVLVVYSTNSIWARTIGNGDLLRSISELEMATNFLKGQLEKMGDEQLPN
jgi:hypothetical protein